MDTMIHIQMMTGPQAGLVNALSQTQITFGRAPDNHLVIDDSHLSRHHGGLQCSDGQWHLINNSPNGTTVNGRKIKHNRPVPIRAGDQVGVGKIRLFAVQFGPASDEAAPGAVPDPATAQRAAADQALAGGKRNKLWVGIGIYLFIFLVIFVVMAMVGRPTKPPPEQATRVTDDQIKAEIIRPLKRTPDQREAEKHLIDAQRWYGRAKTLSTSAALYQAHRHYKLVLAFADKSTLEGLDQLQFDEVEKELIATVQKQYRDAWDRAKAKQWNGAEASLRKLLQIYPDTDSKLFKHFDRILRMVGSKTFR